MPLTQEEIEDLRLQIKEKDIEIKSLKETIKMLTPYKKGGSKKKTKRAKKH